MPSKFPANVLDRIATEHEHFAALLASAPPEVRERLAGLAQVSTLDAGEELYPEGAESEQVGYVLEGALGMVKTLPDGRLHIIGILVPTDMYGRLFDGPSDHRLVALAETRLLTFDRTAFETVLRSAPELERIFLVSVLDELDAAREWILVLNGTRVINRVAAFLVILARRQNPFRKGSANEPVDIRVPLVRRDLAAYLGVRPESLSRAIQQLAREDVIQMLKADHFRVPDLARLVEASGQDLVISDVMGKKRSPRDSEKLFR